jgi:Uma2 family endonuclease
MTTGTRLITADELWVMPGGDQRRELVRGELRMMAPSGGDHGGVTNNIAFLLTAHVKAHGLGQVFAAETGFRLKQSPDTVRGADVSFIRADRIPPQGRPKGYWEIPPDLAVEVLSPADTMQEIEDKVDDYLSAGTRAVWVVNPRRRTVTVHQIGIRPAVVGEGDALDAGDIVPGFRCNVTDIFA